MNLTSSEDTPTPMVAIRSMGLSFESLIGQQVGESRESLVPLGYLHKLMSIANERFVENTKRIERFLTAFRELSRPPQPRKNAEGAEWEDAAARRERKRAEGLRRKAELQSSKDSTISTEPGESALQDSPLVGL